MKIQDLRILWLQVKILILLSVFSLLFSYKVLGAQTTGEEKESFKNYTHSHYLQNAQHSSCVRALYVDETAQIVLNDDNISWSKPIYSKEDDIYSKIVKEIYHKNNRGGGKTNHLLLSFEVGEEDPINRDNKLTWNTFFMMRDKKYVDYCSSPPNTGYESIKIDNEGFPEGTQALMQAGKPIATMLNSTILRIKEEDYPIATHSNWFSGRRSLSRKGYPIQQGSKNICYQYPHSEIIPLNEIIKNPPLICDLVNETTKAIIIKFYSYNDICDDCQEIICDIYPILQGYVGEIPLFIVGINNAAYSCNTYYSFEGGEWCSPAKTTESGTALETNLSMEGTRWNDRDASHYVTHNAEFLKAGQYKPFSGEIKLSSPHHPYFFIYLQQPDTKGINN